ncbi:MAG TPA: transcription termination factor Rho, partial [Ktedonobacterales bacterium]|nr:transcription termination factor Rho [Ktedonobacterales bacterium]
YAPYPPYGSNYPQNYPQGYGQQWGQPNQPSPYGAPPAPYPQGYGRRDGREGYDPYAAQRQAPEYPPNRVERADRNERTRGRGYGTPYPEQNQRGYGEQRDQRERGAPTRPAPYGDQRDQRDQRGVGGRGQPPAPQRGRANRDGQGTVMPPASSLYTNVPPVAPTQPGAGPDGRYAYSPSPRPTVATYGRAVEVNGLVWQHPGHPNSPAEVLDPRTLQPIARLGADELRRMLLRPGDLIEAQAEERGGRRSIVALNSVNDEAPERLRERPIFEQLTALFPDRRIRLEHGARPISARVIDLFAPLGFGSRALIVAPPKTGKTTFIREAAESVLVGYPDAVVMAVLVGERPEEVTDLRARLEPRGGHVYAASFDESTERHAWLVQVAVERAKRVAESGRDAFMVLDSLTRLARAENLATRGQGRTLSGGIDAQALDTGRRAFGAARNLEEGGSITILATCLVDTGSRQDDVVYEEFKGTGNMEIHLSRELAQRRLFPAVDAVKSSTRREEMLLTPEELRGSTALRRRMAGLPTTEATQQLLSVMERTPSNAALLQAIEQSNASGVR